MDKMKEKQIRKIVDDTIKKFSVKLENRYLSEVSDPKGVINSKKNNIFVRELGEEFMFYSAFVRSFDSSFGKVLQNMANDIASLSYKVNGKITSYLLPQQTQHIDYLMTEYDKHKEPTIEDYANFSGVHPREIDSYTKNHQTDNYLYDERKKEHIIIELKSGGDLDNKKSKSEKNELLREFFLLKNKLLLNGEENIMIKIFLATTYNTFGDDSPWKQERVRQYFAPEELLIGRNYWNFISNEEDGYDIIYSQYQISCHYIIDTLKKIKDIYIK